MAEGMVARAIRAGGLAVCVAVAASCGYSLSGRGNFLPDYVRIIGIPPFGNQSSLGDLDRVLTDAVQREFESRGRYKILPDSTGVDALLVATITSVTLTPTAFTGTRQASANSVTVTAKVEFTDTHTNKVLWSNPALRFSEEYQVSSSQTANDPAAFFGSDANALDRLAKDFARSVVTSILEAF